MSDSLFTIKGQGKEESQNDVKMTSLPAGLQWGMRDALVTRNRS